MPYLQLDCSTIEGARIVIEAVARMVVGNPDAVKVTAVQGHEHTLLELEVDPDNIRQIVGREGRMIEAMRTIIRGISGRLSHGIQLQLTGDGVRRHLLRGHSWDDEPRARRGSNGDGR